MVEIRKMLRQVYSEIGALESLRRQRAMVVEDNAGLQAIRYDSEKVSGGFQGDLGDVMENIERQIKRLDRLIVLQLEQVMRHRAEIYQLLEKVANGPGKTAVQEHYLYRVPWGEVALRLHFSKSYVKAMASQCISEVENEMAR